MEVNIQIEDKMFVAYSGLETMGCDCYGNGRVTLITSSVITYEWASVYILKIIQC